MSSDTTKPTAIYQARDCDETAEPFMPRPLCFEHTMSCVSQREAMAWAVRVVQRLARLTSEIEAERKRS